MTLNDRIVAFSILGDFLNQFTKEIPTKNSVVPNNDLFFEKFASTIDNAQHKNGWFLPEQVKHCLLYTSPSPRDKRQSRMPSSA